MMKKTAYTGTFFLCLLINIALNFRLTIPGWILLILHFIFPAVSIWWFVGYMVAFLLYMLIWQLVWRLIGRIGASAKEVPPPKELNPYAVKGNTMPLNRRGPADIEEKQNRDGGN